MQLKLVTVCYTPQKFKKKEPSVVKVTAIPKIVLMDEDF